MYCRYTDSRGAEIPSIKYKTGVEVSVKEKYIEVSITMEQRTLKIVNNCLNTNIYSYLETSGGQSYNLYLNVAQFFNTSLN